MSFREAALLDVAEGAGMKGIAPDRDPESLPASHLSMAENVRFDGGVVKVRRGLGIIQDRPLPPANGELVGAAVFADSSTTQTAFAACHDPALDRTRIYVNQFGAVPGHWGGWLEATASSGQWGDTRIPGRPRRPVSFAGIPGLYGVGRVAVLSGVEGDPPRMIRLSVPTEAPAVKKVEPPLWALADCPVAGIEASLDVASGSWTCTATGGFAASVIQSAPSQALRALAESGAAEGDTAQFLLPLAGKIDASSSPQLLLMTDMWQTLEGWKCLKLEAAAGSGPDWITVFDPESGKEEIVETDLCFEEGETNFRVYAFPLGDLASSLSQLRGFRITALCDLDEGFQADFAMAAASGVVPGGAQYALSFLCSATGAESPGVVMLSSELADSVNQDLLARAVLARAEGVRTATTSRSLPGVLSEWDGAPVTPTVPLDSALFYRYEVPAASPSQAQGQEGVDTMRVYRRDPGESEFTLALEWPVARWSGSAWTPGGAYGPGENAALWEQRTTGADRVLRHDKESGTRMPDGFCAPMPGGCAALFANGRLYVGTSEGALQGQLGAVWVSEEGEPLRFRETSRFQSGQLDESAGGVVTLGADPVTALAEQPGSLLGLGSVLAFTERALYRVEGMRGIKLLDEGTLSPASVCTSPHGTAWMTSRRQAALLDSGYSEPSRGWVSGLWEALTEEDLARCGGILHRGRLAVSFPEASGGGVCRAAVLDHTASRWESIDRLPEGLEPAIWILWEGEPACWTRSGLLLRWEDRTRSDDAGHPITVRLRSRALAAPPGGFLRLRRIGAAGSGGGGSFSARRVFSGPASTAAGTLTWEEERTHKFDSGPGGAPVGGRGESAVVELEGEAPPGWSLYRWTVEAEALARGAREAG